MSNCVGTILTGDTYSNADEQLQIIRRPGRQSGGKLRRLRIYDHRQGRLVAADCNGRWLVRFCGWQVCERFNELQSSDLELVILKEMTLSGGQL